MPAQARIAILSPSLILKRRLKASPENVYAAWTDPAKLKQWFRPGSGPVLPGTKLDVREGGHYTIAVGGEDGEEHRASGVYREVVPGRKLVFAWGSDCAPETDSLVTVMIKLDGDGSILTLIHEQFVDEVLRERHQQGWTSCLDHLEAYLA
jgi:uncharacterized protein YndB with AHSA1/START domain